jgi:hypothetical protein
MCGHSIKLKKEHLKTVRVSMFLYNNSEPEFVNVYGAQESIPRNRSASLCCLAGRYDNPFCFTSPSGYIVWWNRLQIRTQDCLPVLSQPVRSSIVLCLSLCLCLLIVLHVTIYGHVSLFLHCLSVSHFYIVLQKYSFFKSGVHEKREGFLKVFIDIFMFCCVPWLLNERIGYVIKRKPLLKE